jgi:hypothetical protein
MNIKLYQICFAIGLILIGWTISQFVKLRTSHSWPSTMGYVVESKIVTEDYRRGGNYKLKPMVRYKYTVQGQNYISNRISINDISYDDPTVPQQIIDKYPFNKQIKIYYNPSDPQDAVLEFDMNGIYYEFGLGLMLIVLGFFLNRNSKV